VGENRSATGPDAAVAERDRGQVVGAELQERELIKMARLGDTLTGRLAGSAAWHDG
jgi:hypothetical protein